MYNSVEGSDRGGPKVPGQGYRVNQRQLGIKPCLGTISLYGLSAQSDLSRTPHNSNASD